MCVCVCVCVCVLCLVTQSCLTLCGPMDCSPPSSSVHGNFPGGRTTDFWVLLPCQSLWQAALCLFSHKVISDSFATPWTVAHQGPLSIGFPRQEYWGGWPFPPPEDLPNSGFQPTSLALASRFFPTEPSGKPLSPLPSFIIFHCICCIFIGM